MCVTKKNSTRNFRVRICRILSTEHCFRRECVSFYHFRNKFSNATREENELSDSLRSDFHFPPARLGLRRTAATWNCIKLQCGMTHWYNLREAVMMASSSKYKRANRSVCRPSGYLSRFSEIISRTPWLTVQFVSAGLHECKDTTWHKMNNPPQFLKRDTKHFIKKFVDI